MPADETPAFGAIAERFRRAGDLERAVALCKDGLKRFPHILSARVTLGWALLDLGRYDEAREALESVLKRAPDNLAAIRGLAELHDRAEHTMMLPMDGPGQWPPPVDQEDADEIAATAAAVEAATSSEAFEFPPPLTIPIPTPTRAADLDPGIPADVVARAADAVADAPAAPADPADIDEGFQEADEFAVTPAAVVAQPAPPIAVPGISKSAGIDQPSEAPVFLSASGVPLPVATPVPEFEARAESSAAVIEPDVIAPAAAADASAIESTADAAALDAAALDLDRSIADLAELGAVLAQIEEPAASVPFLESETPDALAPAAAALADASAIVSPAVPGAVEDADEIAALEALLAQTQAPEAAPVAAIAAEAIVAPAGPQPEIEVEVDDPAAFRLQPQSIMAMQAVPTAEELAALEAEEEAAIAAALRVALDLPLITAAEAWLPEPEPAPLPVVKPAAPAAPSVKRAGRKAQKAAEPVMAVATAAITPTTPTPLMALERFLRKVQARRQMLAADSMA